MCGRHRHGGPSGWGGWGPWSGWAGGPPAGGPGFKWRFYDRGDLKFEILRLLQDKPMHGYEVMRALEENSGGWYKASAGSIYPTLQMLEDQGYVTAAEQDGKKVYSITEAGRRHLDENRDVVEEIASRVSDFTGRFFGSNMRELTRSFSRLAQVTFERSVKWPGDEDVVRQLREILERAAHEMEAVRPRNAGT